MTDINISFFSERYLQLSTYSLLYFIHILSGLRKPFTIVNFLHDVTDLLIQIVSIVLLLYIYEIICLQD